MGVQCLYAPWPFLLSGPSILANGRPCVEYDLIYAINGQYEGHCLDSLWTPWEMCGWWQQIHSDDLITILCTPVFAVCVQTHTCTLIHQYKCYNYTKICVVVYSRFCIKHYSYLNFSLFWILKIGENWLKKEKFGWKSYFKKASEVETLSSFFLKLQNYSM